ncbi:M48 family metalloprotease [Hydrogenophaga soli]
MERADHLHLIRRCELEAQEHPTRYRWETGLFAALGYLYTLGSATLGLGLLMFAWDAWHRGRHVQALWMAASGATVAWMALSALWHPRVETQGVTITRDQAPDLFKVLDKMRKRLKGPPIHRIQVDDDYNASITQLRRWGLWGRSENVLTLGLPLLLSTSRQRLLGVLAHEYAHLRGGDGHMSAWLYRTRLSWNRLADHAYNREGDNLFAWVSRHFLNWYVPRLMARSFALARHEEYTADRWAGRVVGSEHVAQALMEIHLKAPHLLRTRWQQYWKLAWKHPSPPEQPYQWLARGALRPLNDDELQQGWHHLKTEIGDPSDTHPTTAERVQALSHPLQQPTLTSHHAGSLLGTALEPVLTHFDQRWWADCKADWAHAHRQAQHDHARMQTLAPKVRELDAAETAALARLFDRYDRPEQAQALYARALQLNPMHTDARWAIALWHVQRGQVQALEHLEWLATQQAHEGHAASRVALDLLDRQPFSDDIPALRQRWKERLNHFAALEAEADAETQGDALLEQLAAHDLSNAELTTFAQALRAIPQVARAWVMRRPLRVFPYRRQYVVVVAGRETGNLPGVSLDTVAQKLDLPGPCWVVPSEWLPQGGPNGRHAPLGEDVLAWLRQQHTNA